MRESASNVEPEIVVGQATPKMGLAARICNGLFGLPRSRSLVDDYLFATTEPRGRTDSRRDAPSSPMDAGVTGGLSLLFGNPENRRR